MPKFVPPVVRDNPAILPESTGVAYRLFRHYGPYRRGRSVLRIDGVYRTFDTPTDQDLAAATEVYLGGHVYDVTPEVADALTAAGYQVWAEFTWGDYQLDEWGEIEGTPWGEL